MRRAVARFGLALALLGLPSSAYAGDEDASPSRHAHYHTEQRGQFVPILLGSIFGGLSYTAAVFGGFAMDFCLGFGPNPAPCESAHWPMAIPLVGPFIALGTASDRLTVGSVSFMVADGLVQLGSAALVAYGIAVRVPVSVRDKSTVSIAPLVLDRGSGLSVGGTF
ncbi:hypothetical protein BH09MYX1_BH09MYX1_29570 [soil metagenome]